MPPQLQPLNMFSHNVFTDTRSQGRSRDNARDSFLVYFDTSFKQVCGSSTLEIL